MAPPLGDGDEALRIIPVPDEKAQSLGNLSAIIINDEYAYVSPDALHGRSDVERGVNWVDSLDQVPQPKQYWIAWVTTGRNDRGQRGYRSITVSPMWIDRQAMVGYKRLAQHVNDMKAALDGHIDLKDLPDNARTALIAELKSRGLQYWQEAFSEFKEKISAR